jgi:hypothetical protein
MSGYSSTHWQRRRDAGVSNAMIGHLISLVEHPPICGTADPDFCNGFDSGRQAEARRAPPSRARAGGCRARPWDGKQ